MSEADQSAKLQRSPASTPKPPLHTLQTSIPSSRAPEAPCSFRRWSANQSDPVVVEMVALYTTEILDLCPSMVKGEYNSSVAMGTVLPGLAPIPIGWGTFESDKNLHFFLQAFHEMVQEVPDMDQLTRMLAEMHFKSAEMCDELTKNCGKPAGTMYGFHVTTQHGKLARDNPWTTTWEEYFVRNMTCMLDHDEKEGGPRAARDGGVATTSFREGHLSALAPYGN